METGRQKLLRLLQDEEPIQEHHDQEDQEQTATSQDDDAWKKEMVGELDMVKNLLTSTLGIKNREIETLKKENTKFCEALDEVEEVWARFEDNIKEKDKQIRSKEYELEEKNNIIVSLEEETKNSNLAFEQRLEAARSKISELGKLKNNEHVGELLDEKMKLEKENKALTELVNQKELGVEKCKYDLKILQDNISGFVAIKNKLLVVIKRGEEKIIEKEKDIRENELIINEAENKYRETLQNNQAISRLLEEKEAIIKTLNDNLNLEIVQAKEKEELTNVKMVKVVNQCKESITKVIAKSKASLDALKVENKKLQKETLILRTCNKKKVDRIIKLKLGMDELRESGMIHGKNVDILQSTLQKRVERIETAQIYTNIPKHNDMPQDNPDEEHADKDEPSTSKMTSQRREERVIDNQKEMMRPKNVFENVVVFGEDSIETSFINCGIIKNEHDSGINENSTKSIITQLLTEILEEVQKKVQNITIQPLLSNSSEIMVLTENISLKGQKTFQCVLCENLFATQTTLLEHTCKSYTTQVQGARSKQRVNNKKMKTTEEPIKKVRSSKTQSKRILRSGENEKQKILRLLQN